jgi:biotin synthase
LESNIRLIERLEKEGLLELEEFTKLIGTFDRRDIEFASERARAARERHYGNKVYIRGLIELTSYCRCGCHYCGIGRDVKSAERYRLETEDVLSCCEKGYYLGFRTFVIQGGEDPYYSDDMLTDMVMRIRGRYPDCAITLSLGERSKKSYGKLFDAGADRYLLRHETADDDHYSRLHPAGQTLEERKRCLYDLKEIGFQVGTGFMAGSPWQTAECLAKDMLFMKEIEPEMVGIGPFIPHHETLFRDEKPGSVDLTLFMLALTRIMLPKSLIPATTALGTLDSRGREKGMLSGANVVMPNLSPKDVRKKYLLYDNKAFTGSEAAESLNSLKRSMGEAGFEVVVDRGDHIGMELSADHNTEIVKKGEMQHV